MNNEVFWAILIFGGLAGVIGFLLWRRHRQKLANRTIGRRVFDLSKEPDRRRIAPTGANIWVEDGAECPAPVMTAFEVGLANAFEKAACRGYTRAINHSDYNIAVLKSNEKDSQGFPAYRLPCQNYCGTVYDKGGYILAAGQMVFVGTPYGNWIAIPEHTVSQLEHAQTIAEYEAEHIILAWNDGEEFERTKTHGDGTGHPIIPACPGTPEFTKFYGGQKIVSGHADGYCLLLTK